MGGPYIMYTRTNPYKTHSTLYLEDIKLKRKDTLIWNKHAKYNKDKEKICPLNFDKGRKGLSTLSSLVEKNILPNALLY